MVYISNFEFIKIIISNFQNLNFQIFKFRNFKFQIFKISIFEFAIFRIIRLGFNFGVPKNVKLRRKRFHMKDTGKSSSRKLRHVIYYTLYRMDPQKTPYKISFSAKFIKIQKNRKFGENPYIFPP